jgi:hypothetical protein
LGLRVTMADGEEAALEALAAGRKLPGQKQFHGRQAAGGARAGLTGPPFLPLSLSLSLTSLSFPCGHMLFACSRPPPRALWPAKKEPPRTRSCFGSALSTFSPLMRHGSAA